MGESLAKSSRSIMLRLSLPCNLVAVRSVASAAGEFLGEQGIVFEDVKGCELALVEACNNAIRYVRPEHILDPIEVTVSCQGEAVEIQVADHTPGFDWPSVIELPPIESESGRGLFLIHSLMDQAIYFRSPRMNCLKLRKRCSTVEGSLPYSRIVEVQQMAQQLVESERIIGEMAEELSFCYESLSAIFRGSEELGGTNDFEDFTQRLLGDLVHITSADWFVLRIRKKDELVVASASDASMMTSRMVCGEGGDAGGSAELAAALSRQDVWFGSGNPLGMNDPLTAFPGDLHGLIHPFFFGEELIGTLAVGKVGPAPHFTAVHANVVHTFADFLAIQFVNARLREEKVASRLFTREIEIARNIQRSLLPKSLPNLRGHQLAGSCESAREVGGDFYDVLKVGETGLLLIIADVMGKGIPAAMFAAILRSVVRAVPEWAGQPAILLSRINRLLFEELSGVEMFITAQLVYVDTAERRLVAASAGHCPLLMTDGHDGTVTLISPEGMPLGILPETSFVAETRELSQKPKLLLYTDGLTETRDRNGELFGLGRLTEWFGKRIQTIHSADELKADLASELRSFQTNANPNDDQTFLIMA